MAGRRFTPQELAAAAALTVPDLAGPGLRVLFCGINPSLWSAAAGAHFARPGNRFWKVLHLAGFTERQLSPEDQSTLVDHGLGVTNLVARATARADELSADELRRGAQRLEDLTRELAPARLAFLGLLAYRRAFGRPAATIGAQPETIGATRLWLLPNPSGLQATYQLPELVSWFRALREEAGAG